MNPEKISLQDAVASSIGETADIPPSPPPRNTAGPLKSLRTYQGDIEETINQKKTSMTTIVVAEEKRRQKESAASPVSSEESLPLLNSLKNRTFAIIGLVLILVGGGLIGIVYYLRSLPSAPVSLKSDAIIAYTKQTAVSLDNKDHAGLIGELIKEKNNFSMPVNSLLSVTITQGNATADIHTLFPILAPRAPATLERSLNAAYMIGTYSFDGNEPFIILTTTDYGASYAGMLKWEEGMAADLGSLFGVPQTALSPYVFTDEAIQNKDLRVIRDENKKTVLLYSFLDKNTILIAGNEDLFNALLGKFVTGKLVR